ncbi:MAG: response regulator transcription factor [Rhodospirillales bacterium]|nr:response regulator transcription factor [Rhodospirillales bacterium]
MTAEKTVYVVDDNAAVRRFLSGLIRSVGLRVETYATAQEFLDAYEAGSPGCLLLDIRMPGMSGLELQAELERREIDLPVIILTGHGDVKVAVHAMKAGAIDFIEKPFNNELLLHGLQKAIADSLRSGGARLRRQEILQRVETLTNRERQVLDIVAAGETNKGVARRLGISEKTVEIHRAKVMEKMQAKSLAELVKMAAVLEAE